jgi:predicted DNA-binding transcriptional regulator YafY
MKKWYVAGYCHLRDDIRMFRLDRLELLNTPTSGHETHETFTIPKGFNALEFVSTSLAQTCFEGSVTCRIWFAASLEDITPHVPSYEATLEVQDDGVLLTIVVRPKWLPQIVLYLLAIPAPMKVLEPAGLQAAFAVLSERSLQLSEGKCV